MRAIIEGMIGELKQAEEKAPLANYSRRWALIGELNAVCQELEGLRNLTLCRFIDEKLAETEEELDEGAETPWYLR